MTAVNSNSTSYHQHGSGRTVLHPVERQSKISVELQHVGEGVPCFLSALLALA